MSLADKLREQNSKSAKTSETTSDNTYHVDWSQSTGNTHDPNDYRQDMGTSYSKASQKRQQMIDRRNSYRGSK